MIPDSEAKTRMIDFLEKVSKMCDEEATDLLKITEREPMDLSGFVCSTSIMNVFTLCKMIIEKAKSG